MDNLSLMPGAGSPRPGDLVWSALPGAPQVVHRAPRVLALLRGVVRGIRGAPTRGATAGLTAEAALAKR